MAEAAPFGLVAFEVLDAEGCPIIATQKVQTGKGMASAGHSQARLIKAARMATHRCEDPGVKRKG